MLPTTVYAALFGLAPLALRRRLGGGSIAAQTGIHGTSFCFLQFGSIVKSLSVNRPEQIITAV